MDEDSVYAFTIQAIDNIIDNHIDDIDDCDVMKWADNDIDVYTSDLTGWLNRSDSNVYYLSEALEEYGETDGFKALQIAQMKAREEIYQMVLEVLSDFIDTDSEDKSDDD